MKKRRKSKNLNGQVKNPSTLFPPTSPEPKIEFSEEDPLTGYPASVRTIQGFQAIKTYTCPECNDTVAVGSQHFVVVPIDAPDLRRHWHTYCWVRRKNRVPKNSKPRRKK